MAMQGQMYSSQAQQVYYQYDKDRNGVLKKKEFKKAMQGMLLLFFFVIVVTMNHVNLS